MTAIALIALGCGLAVLLIIAVTRYRRSNHGTHRAPGHRADPFAGVEPGDYDWRDEDPDIGTMTFTGPMPKLTGDTYTQPGWEPLRPLPVQTINLPPWEIEDRPAVSGPRRQELMPLGVDRPWEADRLDLPDLVSDPEMDRPRRGPGDGSQVRQPDLPGAAADVMVGDHRAGEAVRTRRRYTWTSLFGTPDPMPDPQNLPAVESAALTPAIGVSADRDHGGEPVIEGRIVSHVLADTWLQDQLEQLRAWSDSHCQQLADWAQLEVAA